MKDGVKPAERSPTIPYLNMSDLGKIKGECFSLKHFEIDGQSFYSITWVDKS